MAAQQFPGQDQVLPLLYEPLKRCQAQRQIRLLFLEADDDTTEDDPITTSLVALSIKDVKSRYAALSYVWGPPDSSQNIIVNGQPFQLSANLLDFLKSHRRRCIDMPELRRMPLWVDGICINQANVSERSSQVMLMKSVYQDAGMVISWLGTSFPLCDWTFDVLKEFKEQIDRTHGAVESERTGAQLKVTDTSWLSLFPQACQQDLSSEGILKNDVWDSIREFCEHAYWKRTWIFQEIVLADIVMISCGDDMIPFTDVLQVMRWLIGLNGSLEKPDQMEETIWNMISSRDFSERVIGLNAVLRIWEARELKNTSGWALINMLRDSEASDPRDKIYGSLGLTGLDVIPDYSKHVKDVYVEAAKILMEECFELVLTLSGIREHEISATEFIGVPSWTPDWSQSMPGSFPIDHPFTASKHHPKSPNPIADGSILYCHGVVCDEVVAVEPVMELKDCLKFCCDYLASRSTERYPSGIPHLRALFLVLLADWSTMIDCRFEPECMIYQVIACGLIHLFLGAEISHRTRTGRPQIDNPLCALGLGANYADLTTTFWNQVVGTSNEPTNCVITGLRDQQSAAMNAIGEKLAPTVQVALVSALMNRKIFHTRSGYIGIGSESTRPGDHVCVAFDCDLPIILRPEDSHFTHIGACYVVGLMEGEAMLDIRKGNRGAQRFEIW